MDCGRLFIVFVLLACGSSVVGAQPRSRALDLIPWHVRVEPDTVRPGGEVRMVFQARLGESDAGPWKMYAAGSPLPTRGVQVELDEPLQGLLPLASLQQRDARSGYDPWFDTTVVYFEKEALLWQEFAVAADEGRADRQVGGTIAFMVCNDHICLPPARRTFAVTVVVRKSGRAAPPKALPKYRVALFKGLQIGSGSFPD